MFNSEAEFEAALIKKLTDECGWDKKILRNCSEKDLIKNWVDEGEENFVGDSEIIALGGASNETKDRPLG